MPRARFARLTLALALVSLRPSTAAAHIDLLEPEARAHGTAAFGDMDVDDNSNLKNAPCGQVVSGRTDRVATYAPGETITVRVREENAHESYLRVSIDLDGEEFPLRDEYPGGPETQDEAQAAEDALGGDGLLAVVREDNDTAGFVHEIAVTLPDQACDGCTLQVLQYMYDDPAAPYYFQCADLVIARAAGGADAGGVAPDGDEPGGDQPNGDDGSDEGGEGIDVPGLDGPIVEDPGADAPSSSEPTGVETPGADTDVPPGGDSPGDGMVGGGASPTSSVTDVARVASGGDGGGGCRTSPGPRGRWGAGLLGLLALALAARRRQSI